MAREFPMVMEWNPTNIIVTRSTWFCTIAGYSFVGAIHTYSSAKFGDIPFMFSNGRVYTFMYEDATEPIKLDKFLADIKGALKRHDCDYPEFHREGDKYFEVYNGCEWQEGVLDYLDIREHKEDISNRYDDVMQMWEFDEVPVGIVVS